MHLYLEGIVKDVDTIRYSSAAEMTERGVKVHPNTKVLAINPDKHEIHVRDLKTNKERTETYDKLILGTGVSFNVPDIPGMDLENVYFFGGREAAEILRHKEVSPEIKDVVILGGGYIALEAAICFAEAGKSVTMLNRDERLLETHLDEEMTALLTKECERHGITYIGNALADKLDGEAGKVKTVHSNQGVFPAQLVICAIGNHPNTAWLKDTLELNKKGFIMVDDYMKTSAPDVFAAGGGTLMKCNPIDGKAAIDLASNARKQGRVAAKNLTGDHFPYPGMQGTSALKAFDYYFAATGVNATYARYTPMNTDSVYIETTALDPYLPESMNAKVYAKLFYEKGTRRVLGGQIFSKKDMTGMIQALSVAVYAKLTIDELAFFDFFFQPLFNRPWNVLNELGLAAQKKEA